VRRARVFIVEDCFVAIDRLFARVARPAVEFVALAFDRLGIRIRLFHTCGVPTNPVLPAAGETMAYGALERRGAAGRDAGAAWPIRKAGADEPVAPLTGPLVVEPLTVPA
jgi:hypothetical protein